MIHFVSWKWNNPGYRTRFTAHHVNVLAASIRRNYGKGHRFICVTDDPEGLDPRVEAFPLWGDCADLVNPSGRHLPSCYRRLRIFSPFTTSEMDIGEGETVVSIDLDVVVTGRLEKLLAGDDDFKGWVGVGTHHAKVYNGSLFKFKAGRCSYLWDEFDPKVSPRKANDALYFGSDQSWLSYRLAGVAPGWGREDGVLSYAKDFSKSTQVLLPPDTRIVSFNGRVKPWDPAVMDRYPWVAQHWGEH